MKRKSKLMVFCFISLTGATSRSYEGGEEVRGFPTSVPKSFLMQITFDNLWLAIYFLHVIVK